MTSLPVILAAGGTAAALRVPALFAAVAVLLLVWAVRARTRSARFAYLSLLFGALGFCTPENVLGWDPATHPAARVFLAARVVLGALGLLFCFVALALRKRDRGGLLVPAVGGLTASLHLVGVFLTLYLFGLPGGG